VLITTKRIVWRSGQTSREVRLDHTVTVNVPDFMDSNKLDLYGLWLITTEGGEYSLETEPGEPFFVLWNLLICVIQGTNSVS
jgi:hypothetical protein